jgi:hypothetical protein
MTSQPKQLEFILVEREYSLASHRLAMQEALRLLKPCRADGPPHRRDKATYVCRLLENELRCSS